MRIKEIKSQHRRDFRAVYECEHCGKTEELGGYDDDNFHQNVVPNMKCSSCGKKAPDGYKGKETKYKSWEVI